MTGAEAFILLGFFLCGISSMIFLLQMGGLAPLIVIYSVFVREEEFPAFPGVFAIDLSALCCSGVRDYFPPRHCCTLCLLSVQTPMSLCSISH